MRDQHQRPRNSSRLSSKISSVGISRSLVGSSSNRTSAGWSIQLRDQHSRPLSTESRLTGWFNCSPVKRNRARHDATWITRS